MLGDDSAAISCPGGARFDGLVKWHTTWNSPGQIGGFALGSEWLSAQRSPTAPHWSGTCIATGADTGFVNRQYAADYAAEDTGSLLVLLVLIGLLRSVEEQRAALSMMYARS